MTAGNRYVDSYWIGCCGCAWRAGKRLGQAPFIVLRLVAFDSVVDHPLGMFTFLALLVAQGRSSSGLRKNRLTRDHEIRHFGEYRDLGVVEAKRGCWGPGR